MSILLDPPQRRILGCLVEKQLATPDVYPLTLNSLVLAANQKSNREPLSAYREYEIQGALRALMDREWVSELDRAGGRTARYGHRAGEQLSVDDTDLAILAELWLRGPQSAQELATRASRMRPVASPEAAEARLQALAQRPVPYVRFLGRRPGERVPRWAHRFGDEPVSPAGEAAIPSASDGRPAPAATSYATSAATSASTSASPGTSPAAPSRPMPATSPDVLADLLERVERLERTVAELRSTIGG